MAAEQQFCLRWNNHQSTLISVFDTLLESETLVDVTLAAEGQCLKAHKVVLSACSPYFQEILSQHFEKHPIVILKDVKFEELKALVDYMYRGEVNVSQEQLSALIKTAESLKIKGLADGGSSGDKKHEKQTSQARAVPYNQSLAAHPPLLPQKPEDKPETYDITKEEAPSSPLSKRARKRVRRRSGGSEQDRSELSASPQASVEIRASTIASTKEADDSTVRNAMSSPVPVSTSAPVSSTPVPSVNLAPISTQALPATTPSTPKSTIEEDDDDPMLIEPKTEAEDEDESKEGLCDRSDGDMLEVDEDELGVDAQAGPSHVGDDGVTGQGGFASWLVPGEGSEEVFQVSHDGSQREGQESVGNRGVTGMHAGQTAGLFHATESFARLLASTGGRFDVMSALSLPPEFGGIDLQQALKRRAVSESGRSDPTAGLPAFSCTKCGNTYARAHSLSRHLKFECGVEPKFECPICHKKSKHKHNLILHMRTHQK